MLQYDNNKFLFVLSKHDQRAVKNQNGAKIRKRQTIFSVLQMKVRSLKPHYNNLEKLVQVLKTLPT